MKRILFIAALLSLSHNNVFAQEKFLEKTSSSQPPIEPVNGIAVVVNNEVITTQELRDRVRMIEQRLKAQGVALPPRTELQRQIVERLIVDRAQLQLARDTGLRVDDIMLDRAIARIAEQNKMTLQAFRNQIENDGMSYAEFRESVRDDILMQRIVDREVASKIQVPESEIDNFLLTQNADKKKNQEIELSQILIRIPENATPEMTAKIRKQAESVLKKVNNGSDFSQLAVTYSNSVEGLKGGSLGWRKQDRYPQLFTDAIADLKVGDTTGVIKSPSGFHILKLTGKRTNDSSSQSVLQSNVRHIMLKITPALTKEQAKHKLLEFKQRIENDGARFEDLAKKFSNDGAASRGGDLGWLYPGDVPQFDRIISGLKAGQISAPIETSDGVHIIQLLGTKKDEVSPERQRMLARQLIHARKADEATIEWMHQLRDSAYVEIRSNDNYQ